jgi:hypothetical protein
MGSAYRTFPCLLVLGDTYSTISGNEFRFFGVLHSPKMVECTCKREGQYKEQRNPFTCLSSPFFTSNHNTAQQALATVLRVKTASADKHSHRLQPHRQVDTLGGTGGQGSWPGMGKSAGHTTNKSSGRWKEGCRVGSTETRATVKACRHLKIPVS